ncbi:MAG: NAD(P)H-binding protein [Beijerinckiaceae bacterium]|nr:NAD(P)H-binding protein [Beijerinckiaceae bacterium]
MLGATGTIGRATVKALLARGHAVICAVRDPDRARACLPEGTDLRSCDVSSANSLRKEGLRGENFDALVSCLASRSGAPADAWAIDNGAHLVALAAARDAGVRQVVLLSAICVQKPLLAFQHAKLAFEATLMQSGLTYSIVRPTAYFKSLSGQLGRLRAGKPFLIFGNGELTACKPISDADLAAYLAGCLDDEARWNRILPIGGPGPALTPREQGELLFAALGQAPRYRSVPVGLLDGIIALLSLGGRFSPRLAAKAELARIGRYYATESMLVLDPATGRYDADATPETGTDTLAAFYGRLVWGEETIDRGEHAVF